MNFFSSPSFFSLFSSGFALSCQNIKVSYHLFFIANLVLIFIIAICFVLFCLYIYYLCLQFGFCFFFIILLIEFFFYFIAQHFILIYFYVKFGHHCFYCNLFYFRSFFIILFFFSISSLNILFIKNFASLFFRVSFYVVSPGLMAKVRILKVDTS